MRRLCVICNSIPRDVVVWGHADGAPEKPKSFVEVTQAVRGLGYFWRTA